MKQESKILGVCLWLAQKFDLDTTGVRLVFVIAAIFSGGTWLIIYILLYFIMPKEKQNSQIEI